ncbi:diguanylate cyclase [Azospirillum sp.]|uniref:GGDEF domain-containing response regulator n=1 Tax=Azospirillum sp. TaxID=34012 RepID=UPI002D408192|nr:diguanylate cyclase [Azospirillum sp.]HYD71198.1 diguanylate cyclase [Azospirillum sp.]
MPETRNIDVLLVEDDPADAGLVRHALRTLGSRFALTHRASLDDALAWLADHGCDVVLLDLSLPDSSGFDTIRRMREAFPAMPLVVLTGHDDEDFAIEAMAAGTQDYLFKGATDGPVLQRAIRYAIARKQLEEKLRHSEQRLLSIVTLAQDAILSVDARHRIVLFNPAAERMFGYAEADVLGRPLDMLIPPRLAAAHRAHVADFVIEGPSSRSMADRNEVVGLARDGREFPVEISISKDLQPDGMLLTAVIRDITERKRFENELRHLATTDPLTGLANRRQFLAAAERELVRVRRYDRPATVLMFDIDHFKRINDTHGHAAGDEALRHVAAVCRDLLRETDIVGRLGGEEFGILLPETDVPSAREAAERLRLALARAEIPRPDGGTLRLTASIGIAACMPGDAGIEQALSRADDALYHAKANGRNRVEVKAPELSAAS